MTYRQQLMDAIIAHLDNATPSEMNNIEKILDRHGASEDGSDPNEGFFVTMSDDDLQDALDEIEARSNTDDDSDSEKFYELLSSKSNLSAYEEGWLEGYEAAMDRYDIDRR